MRRPLVRARAVCARPWCAMVGSQGTARATVAKGRPSQFVPQYIFLIASQGVRLARCEERERLCWCIEPLSKGIEHAEIIFAFTRKSDSTPSDSMAHPRPSATCCAKLHVLHKQPGGGGRGRAAHDCAHVAGLVALQRGRRAHVTALHDAGVQFGPPSSSSSRTSCSSST